MVRSMLDRPSITANISASAATATMHAGIFAYSRHFILCRALHRVSHSPLVYIRRQRAACHGSRLLAVQLFDFEEQRNGAGLRCCGCVLLLLLLLRDLTAVDTSNRLLPVTCGFCRFLVEPFAPARCLRIQQLSDAMRAKLDAHTAKGANIQSFLYRASLRMMYM